MEIQLSVHDWLKLPMETRNKLREIFNIPKSRGAIVESNVVMSDGTTYEDLQAITLGKMQKHLDSELSDFVTLFNTLVTQLEEEKELEPLEPVIDPKQLIVDEWVAVMSRIKGQAVEHSMEDHLKAVVARVFETNPLTNPDETKRKTKKTK